MRLTLLANLVPTESLFPFREPAVLAGWFQFFDGDVDSSAEDVAHEEDCRDDRGDEADFRQTHDDRRVQFLGQGNA